MTSKGSCSGVVSSSWTSTFRKLELQWTNGERRIHYSNNLTQILPEVGVKILDTRSVDDVSSAHKSGGTWSSRLSVCVSCHSVSE